MKDKYGIEIKKDDLVNTVAAERGWGEYSFSGKVVKADTALVVSDGLHLIRCKPDQTVVTPVDQK